MGDVVLVGASQVLDRVAQHVAWLDPRDRMGVLDLLHAHADADLAALWHDRLCIYGRGQTGHCVRSPCRDPEQRRGPQEFPAINAAALQFTAQAGKVRMFTGSGHRTEPPSR